MQDAGDKVSIEGRLARRLRVVRSCWKSNIGASRTCRNRKWAIIL